MVKVTREDAITGGDIKCKNGWWLGALQESYRQGGQAALGIG
jgi:nitrogen fixation protein